MKDPPPYHVAYVVGNTLQVYSTQYSTVHYSTVHSTVHVAGNTLQVYSTVPCGCLEKKQPGLRIIFRFLV
jgi:hypothetical protein